jgi:hypothetical protein
MILSSQEVDSRLAHDDNLHNKLKKLNEDKSVVKVIDKPHGGRKEGDSQVPSRVRSLLGGLARHNGDTQIGVASTFGVSQPTVGAASRGLIGNRFDEDLNEEIEQIEKKSINDAHEEALSCLMDSLTRLKPALVDETNAVKLSKIAKDMASITSHLKPKEEAENRLSVVVMTVPQKKVESYETIDV